MMLRVTESQSLDSELFLSLCVILEGDARHWEAPTAILSQHANERGLKPGGYIQSASRRLHKSVCDIMTQR